MQKLVLFLLSLMSVYCQEDEKSSEKLHDQKQKSPDGKTLPSNVTEDQDNIDELDTSNQKEHENSSLAKSNDQFDMKKNDLEKQEDSQSETFVEQVEIIKNADDDDCVVKYKNNKGDTEVEKGDDIFGHLNIPGDFKCSFKKCVTYKRPVVSDSSVDK